MTGTPPLGVGLFPILMGTPHRYPISFDGFTLNFNHKPFYMAEGVGIEPTGDNIIAPHTALKAGTATRRHPLPASI